MIVDQATLDHATLDHDHAEAEAEASASASASAEPSASAGADDDADCDANANANADAKGGGEGEAGPEAGALVAPAPSAPVARVAPTPAASAPVTPVAPAAMIGYQGLLPAELVAELAKSARLRPVIHPGDAPPEAGYTPSQALADFIRCRDLTCRFPGCTRPATRADVDHTIPHAAGGPTQASNLKCLCRLHHLIKTFWGWTDEQLRDGTVIWTAPSKERYVTHPGSALLFPGLCAPTAPIRGFSMPAPPGGYRTTAPPTSEGRAAKMPRRTRTRTKQRAADIATERAHNHRTRTTPQPAATHDEHVEYDDTFQDANPPPF